jgi:hypothetical protein
MEVPTSGSGKNASWGGSQIFTVNNDVDCVGDMYLSLAVELNKPAASSYSEIQSATNFTGSFGYAEHSQTQGAASVLLSSLTAGPAAPEVAALSLPFGLPLWSSATTRDEIKFAPPVSGSDLWTLTGTTTPAFLSATSTIAAAQVPPLAQTVENILLIRLATLYADDIEILVSNYNYGPVEGVLPLSTFATADAHAAAIAAATAQGAYSRGAILMTFSDAHSAVDAARIRFDLPIPLRKGVADMSQQSTSGNGIGDVGALATAADSGGGFGGNVPNWQSYFDSVPHSKLAGAIAGSVAQPSDVASWTRSGKWGGSNLTSKVKFPLANIIKRIEFQVGTQIWQTLEYSDLLAINATELPESSYNRLGLQTSGFVRSDGQREHTGPPTWTPGAKYQAFIPLPMLTKSIAPQLENFTQHSEDGYLMAAAPHQNVKVKVHYAAFADIFKADNVYAKEGWNDTAGLHYISQLKTPWVPTATLSTKLYAQHMIMCNEEREQMKNMANGIPKRLKMTQNVNVPFPAKIYPDQAITVDLDHYSIYGSHLIITASFPGLKAKDMPALKYAELKLNSSSFSGQLDGTLLKGITNKSLGLYANEFNLEKSQLDTGMGYYVFPLAARAFGGSSVPLNRFDNIRLLLTFSHPDITSSGMAVARGQINVTGVGETTGLYKAGAASLAMY